MNKTYYDIINENIYEDTLSNGLKIYMIPKLDYHRTYGLIGVNLGALDQCYSKEGIVKTIPDGSPHFLEHKMYESKLGDYSDRFAKLGANSNAYTSLNMTCYEFSTTQNVLECTQLLLDLVSSLECSKESVEKEKKIIKDEIKMYDDDYEWQCYFRAVANLYHSHPIKKDICGNISDVNHIYYEKLKELFDDFYTPDNMCLVLIGNFDLTMIKELKLKENHHQIVHKIMNYQEDLSVYKNEEILYEEIALDKINITIKVNDSYKDSYMKQKREVCMNLLLDLFFSKSSKNYYDLLRRNIINDSFSCSYSEGNDYAYAQFELMSENIDLFEQEIKAIIHKIPDAIINEEEFIIQRNKNLGYLLTLYDSFESTASNLIRNYFNHSEYIKLIEIINSICLNDLLAYQKLFNCDLISVCKIYKK